MGNKNRRKPRTSVRLLRKRIGRKAYSVREQKLNKVTKVDEQLDPANASEEIPVAQSSADTDNLFSIKPEIRNYWINATGNGNDWSPTSTLSPAPSALKLEALASAPIAPAPSALAPVPLILAPAPIVPAPVSQDSLLPVTFDVPENESLEELVRWRRTHCTVFGCLNTTINHPDYTFFKIPNHPERRVKWLRLIAREDLIGRPANSHSVCEIHFNPRDILPGSERKLLKHTAVPTLHLPATQIKDIQTQAEDASADIVIQEPVDQLSIHQDDMSKETQPIDNETAISSQTLTCNIKVENEYDELNIDIEQNPIEFINMMTVKLESDEASPMASSSNNLKRKVDDVLEKQHSVKMFKQTEAQTKTNNMNFGFGNTYTIEAIEELLKPRSCFHYKDHPEYTLFCMNLYQTSPQAYLLLLQNILNLPQPNTLKNSIPITSGIDETVLSILKTKVNNMTDAEKNCAMALTTFDLKENLFYDIKEDKIVGFHDVDGVQTTAVAKTALIVTIRGIVVDWKQPITYALLSKCPNYDTITKWIDNLLEQLFKIGLNVRTFVSNKEPNIYGEAKTKAVTVEQPYFVVNDRKIYYIFDPCLLLNDVRDNFVRYDFQFQNKVAKSEYVRTYYNLEEQNADKLAPKLSESDLNPSKGHKDTSPTQLFNKDVAKGLSTYIHFRAIDQSAKDTVEFIKLMDSLCDALYTASPKNNENGIPFLKEMLSFFTELKLIDPTNGEEVTSKAKFISCVQITIKSILMLHEEFKTEGIISLPIRRLTHTGAGFLEPKNSNQQVQTARGILNVYRKVFQSNIMKPTKGRACDIKKILISLKLRNDGLFNTADNCKPTELDDFDAIQIPSSEYKQLLIPRNHTMIYISGYLLGKCRDHHRECEILKSYIKTESFDSMHKGSYVKYIIYSHHGSKNEKPHLLAVPTDEFVAYVESLEEIFRSSFEGRHVNSKIAVSLYKAIRNVNNPYPPCPCFPIVYMKKLFIRLRLFMTMQSMNKHAKANSLGRIAVRAQKR